MQNLCTIILFLDLLSDKSNERSVQAVVFVFWAINYVVSQSVNVWQVVKASNTSFGIHSTIFCSGIYLFYVLFSAFIQISVHYIFWNWDGRSTSTSISLGEITIYTDTTTYGMTNTFLTI